MDYKHTTNKALKSEIQTVLRNHKVKGIRHHMKHMNGSGLFDTLSNAVKKGVEIGKKGYDLYNKHKDTINKVVDFGVKNAPSALALIKKIKGGKRSLPPALKEWQNKCRDYAEKHSVSYKQAMTALKKH